MLGLFSFTVKQYAGRIDIYDDYREITEKTETE